MSLSKVFFESFNGAVEAAYDAYFRIAEKDILKGLSSKEGELDGYLRNETLRWAGTSLSELDGMTPGEYVDSVDEPEELVTMFREGAILCDADLPGIFLDRLHSFGSTAVEALLGLCRDVPLSGADEESLMAPLMAVQVLGGWKAPEAVGVLIGMLDYRGEASDLLYEKVRAALISIGKPAVESMLAAMESQDPDSPQAENLVMALSDAARGSGPEAVYRRLKSAFLNMSNKAVGAYCLGNYGDGRAIPALRGYLLKNRGNISKETYFDVLSAIKRLGGSAEDLENPGGRGGL